ncbi:MAG: MarR family winged helix-turn-helix transcriptional regulator [Gaiellaceae bacterium]
MSAPQTPAATTLAEAVERLLTALVRQPRMPGDEPGELSTFQGITLSTLVDEGPARLGALANALGTTDATASRTVDVLELAGLAARLRDEADGRCIVVAATDAGRALVRARRKRLERLVARLVEDLGADDGARLAELLGELRGLLSENERLP